MAQTVEISKETVSIRLIELDDSTSTFEMAECINAVLRGAGYEDFYIRKIATELLECYTEECDGQEYEE